MDRQNHLPIPGLRDLPPTAELGLLLIASEQMAPNLEAIGHFMREGQGLRALRILHSKDEARSRLPANRLLNLVGRKFPGLDARLVLVDTRPEKVHAQALALITEQPGRWVLNATGGLKSMAFGLLPLLRVPGTEMIYLELGKGWMRIAMDGDGVPCSTTFPVSADAADWMWVEEFITCQDQEHAGFEMEFDTAEDKPAPGTGGKLAEVVREAADKQWHWERVQALKRGANCTASREHRGICFERFVVACLAGIGINNVARGVKVLSRRNQPVEENDVCALHGGRLFHIDCCVAKSGGTNVKGAFVSQFNDAISRSIILGGKEAQTVLLRLGLVSVPEVAVELAKAKRIVLLTKADWTGSGRDGFLYKLAGVFGIRELPADALEAQRIMDTCRGRAKTAGNPEPRPGKQGDTAVQGWPHTAKAARVADGPSPSAAESMAALITKWRGRLIGSGNFRAAVPELAALEDLNQLRRAFQAIIPPPAATGVQPTQDEPLLAVFHDRPAGCRGGFNPGAHRLYPGLKCNRNLRCAANKHSLCLRTAKSWMENPGRGTEDA